MFEKKLTDEDLKVLKSTILTRMRVTNSMLQYLVDSGNYKASQKWNITNQDRPEAIESIVTKLVNNIVRMVTAEYVVKKDKKLDRLYRETAGRIIEKLKIKGVPDEEN